MDNFMEEFGRARLRIKIQEQKDKIIKEFGGFHQSEDSLWDLGYLDGLQNGLKFIMGFRSYWNHVYSETSLEDIKKDLKWLPQVLEDLEKEEPKTSPEMTETQHYLKHEGYYDGVSDLVVRIMVAEEIIRKK